MKRISWIIIAGLILIAAFAVFNIFIIDKFPNILGVSGAQYPIKKFQPISQNSGWVLMRNKIFITNSSGDKWRDITPNFNGIIQSGYFLSESTGWILATENSDSIQSVIFKTGNGGENWVKTVLFVFEENNYDAFSYDGELRFSDSNSGVVLLKAVSSSNFSLGWLFTTDNSGNTWIQSRVPFAGNFSIHKNQIWLAGGTTKKELYLSKDKGLNWESIKLPITETRIVSIYPPDFQAQGITLLPVLTKSEHGKTFQLLSTNSSSSSWKVDNYSIDVLSLGSVIPASLQNETLYILESGKLVTYSYSSQTANSIDLNGNNGLELEFSLNNIGWILTQSELCDGANKSDSCLFEYQIFQTDDEGLSIKRIDLPTIEFVAESKIVLEKALPDLTERTSVFIGQAFDACELPSKESLEMWKLKSPYQAINLYIGGSSRACANSLLSKDYLMELSKMGWKFIPTWVGPQASCSSFINRMDSDPDVAYQQGRQEAEQALITASQLGLTNENLSDAVIYYDLEAFSVGNQSCLNAAKAFINGWDSRIKESGSLAGLYGASCTSGMTEMASLDVPPDAVWLANWIENSYFSGASTENVNCLSNNLWSNYQRIRQYAGDHNETWGGIMMNIDSNVSNGIVSDLSKISNESDPKLLNTSFESGILDWQVMSGEQNCEYSILSNDAYSGIKLLSLKNNPSSDCKGVSQEMDFLTYMGDSVRLAVWSKNNSNNSSGGFSLQLELSGGNMEQAKTEFYTENENWACSETSITTSQNGHSKVLVSILTDSNMTSEILFDFAILTLNSGPLCPKPLPPSNVQASDGSSSTEISISWDAVPNIENYKIYRSDIPGVPKIILGSTEAASFVDSTVPWDSYQYYWISSCTDLGCSPLSIPDSGHIVNQPGTAVLFEPSGVITTPSPSFSWQAADYATHYRLLIEDMDTSNHFAVYNQILDGSIYCSGDLCAALPNLSLLPGHFAWTIQSKNLFLDGILSPYKFFDRLIASPTAFEASDGNYLDKIFISWEMEPEAAFYEVYRAVSSTPPDEPVYSTTELFFEDYGVMNNLYFYWIKACNSDLCSQFSPLDTGYTTQTDYIYIDPVSGSDYDGDGISDVGKFYSNLGLLEWQNSSSGTWDGIWLGADDYQIIPGSDFDGDGKTDPAKFYPSTGTVWWINSSTDTWAGRWLGSDGFELVIGSDFDGDSVTDHAKYYSQTNTLWWINSSTNSWQGIWLGGGVFKLVTGSDYDGDNKTDPAKFSEETGLLSWFSSLESAWQGIFIGTDGDFIVEKSDFDEDGKTDPAKYVSNNNMLWWLSSQTGDWKGIWMGSGIFEPVFGSEFSGGGQTNPAKFIESENQLHWYDLQNDQWNILDLVK